MSFPNRTSLLSLLTFITGFVTYLSGQEIRFEHFNTRNGLLSDEVYNLHQDRKGYIWLFTLYGAMKFNGHEFKQTLTNLPYSRSIIYSAFEDETGRLWLANSKCDIYQVRNDSAIQLKGSEKLTEVLHSASQEIYQLYVDDSVNVFAISKNQSYKLWKKKNGYELISLSETAKHPGGNFTIMRKNSAFLTILTMRDSPYSNTFSNLRKEHGRVFIYVDGDARMQRVELTGKKTDYYMKYAKQHDSDVYISDYQNLLKLRNGQLVSTLSFNGVINNFNWDRRGHLWVAVYNGGLFELNEKDSVLKRYFPNVSVNDVLVDDEGGIWASTASQGLYHARNVEALHYPPGEPPGKPVTFLKKIDNRLFAGFAGSGVYEFSGSSYRLIDECDPSATPLAMARMGNHVFISYRLEMKKLSAGLVGRKNAVESRDPNILNVLSIVPLQDRLIILNRRCLERYFPNGQAKRFALGQRLFTFLIWQGKFLVGTESGVFTINAKEQEDLLHGTDTVRVVNERLVPLYPELEGHAVTMIEQGPDKSAWICTRGNGLFKLDTIGNVTRFSSPSDLPSNIIHDIVFFSDSAVVATNNGIYVSSLTSNKFNKWSLLLRDDASHLTIHNGKIFAGTHDGLVVLNRKVMDERVDTYLSSVLVNSTPVDTNSLLGLEYYQNNIEFNFDVVSVSERLHRLNYVLRGPVNDRGNLLNNQLKLQHLPPGEYTLVATAAIPGTRPVKLRFVIIPAFWQRPAIQVLFVLGGVAIVSIIALLIFRGYRRKTLARMKEEELINEYKLIAIKAQANPHFMSNCLSAIQNLVISGEIDRSSEYLARFSIFLRDVLDSSDKFFLSLAEEINIMTSYIELEQLRFGQLDYSIVVDKSLDAREILVPSLIMQPYIENAIWHGLMPLKDRQPKLDIEISRTDDTIRIEIIDNGVGRGKTQPRKKSRSRGLQLAEEQIRTINRITGKDDYAVQIIDLYSTANEPTGTKVVLSLSNYSDE